MDTMIVAARTVHFASAILLFGTPLLALTVATPIWRRAARDVDSRPALLPRALRFGAWTLAAAVISAVIWLVGEASAMSGKPIAQMGGDTIGLVLGKTVFGRLWLWRLGLAIALAALLWAIGRSADRRRRLRLAAGALLVATAYLATLAWAGHAAAGPPLQVVSDVAHLIAAGAWLGALPGLVVLLGCAQPLEITAEITRRFSTLGVLSVGTLIVTGLGNSWYLVGDIPGLVGTPYGRLLLVKLALFAAMVALATFNRFSLTERVSAQRVSSFSALRTLRRNATLEIAAGMIVVAIVGLLGTMIPAAHQSPVWPFKTTLSWLPAQLSFGLGTIVVMAGIVACVAAAVAVRGVFRNRWGVAIAGFVAMVVATAIGASLLAVPAYPTTYAMGPMSYTADAIVRGAGLYAQNCAICHGPLGRGDGPAGASLPSVPADLAAHGSSHRPGELFWWVAHGIPGTPMPAFTPHLNDAEIWDLVQFLRAQSDAAAAATTLNNHVEPWRAAIVAPDFAFESAGREQDSLRQPQGNPVTLLVFYTLPQSLPYLHALGAEIGTFGEIGARVIAVPMPGSQASSDAKPAGEGALIFASAPPDAITAYAMFARKETDLDNVVPVQADYLIDRQGYIRARWIGVADAPANRIAEIFDQAELLRRERLRAPASAHMHR
jgi:putative copper export protein/mono/diheme cytochrome c family protein